MTDMAPIDDIVSDVLVYASSCPEPRALKELRKAARAFCKSTKIWREWDEIPIISPECEGISTYSEAGIVEIESARFDGRDLTPVTPQWLDEQFPGWSEETDEGLAEYVTQIAPNTVTVYPAQSGTLRVRLVLQPSRQADEFPLFLIDDYGDELAKGAAGAILMLPKKEFSNPQLGVALLGEWNALIDKKKITVAKGQQVARQRTKPRFM